MRIATTLLLAALIGNADLSADRILVIGDSWAKPVGPELQEVLKENGHPDIAVDTPPFVYSASQLGSPSGLDDISAWIAEKPDVTFVQLSIGGNDWEDSDWVPSWASTQLERYIINTIVSNVDAVVDHIHSLRPDIRILWSSYDFPRPVQQGTPEEVNSFLIRLAAGMAQFAASKPGVSFVDIDGTLQLVFGFDGVKHSRYDPGSIIPPGDPSLPNPSYPSPIAPFLQGSLWHLKSEGYKALAQAQYDGYYASVLSREDFQINPGLNDAWFNPATQGQGFLLTVLPDTKQMFLAWFTFDTERPDGSAEARLGEPGHRWLTAQGPYDGDTAALTIYLTEGGVFDAAQPAATTDPDGDGTLTLEFADCNTGLVTYEITSTGLHGTVPIERIALDNVPLCESLSHEPASTE